MADDDSEVIHGSSSAISVPAATFAAIFLSQKAFSMKYAAVESSEIYQNKRFGVQTAIGCMGDVVMSSDIVNWRYFKRWGHFCYLLSASTFFIELSNKVGGTLI